MNGFKSFGKRTELLFGDKFNVILGPNGSGKSNVMDALIFVLGKAGSKGLRAEKSANLIYNGGKTKQPAKQGEVSIYFDNKNKVFPTEEDSVKITRIIKHSGQSIYKINDKTRTRQQILDLLSIAKINPDGYNIILQGDIVSLVEMSGIERRQIIEEIAGINVYEEKKLKALKELEKVDEKITESEIVLKERESYLKDLKKDRDQALKYKEFNDKIKQNKATYLKKQIEEKEAKLELLKKDMDRYKADFQKIQSKIQEMRNQIKQNKDQINEISEEVEQKGEVETVQLQKQIESLRVDIATKQERINNNQNELSKIAQRREQLKRNLGEVTDKIEVLKDRQKELKEKQQRSEALKKELDTKTSAFREKNKLNDTEGIYKKIEEIDKKAESLQNKTQELREQQQNLIREKDRTEFQIQHMDDKIKKVHEIEKEHEQEIKALKQKKEEFKKATLEPNKLLDNDSTLAKQLAIGRQDLLKIAENIARLESQKFRQQERSSGDRAVKEILQNKNKFKGVYGTVGELGVVDKKYNLALEVAAGKKIQSIVVEDDEVAARCIQYLKTNKLGTAAFLPLNKIKPERVYEEVKKLKKEQGVLGLALDLISFDSKFSNIFSYVFGNALIVNSIETARKIGIGKAKMVTLDGDIATTSGAMIGGYRDKKHQGAFKEEDVTKDLEETESESAELQISVSKLQKQKQENEEEITKLREFKASLEGELIKTEKSLHLDSSDLQASQSYKKDLGQELIKIDKDLDKIVEEVSTTNMTLAKMKQDKEQLREQANALRNPRLLAELNAFEEKKTEVTQDILQISSDLKNIEVQIKEILGRDAEASDRVIKELSKEEKQFEEETKVLEKDIKQQKSDLKKKEEEQQKSHSKFRALYEKRNKLNDEITAIEQKLFTKEEESRKAEFKVNTLSLEETKYRAEKAALDEDFAQYEGVELVLNKSEEQLKKEISQFERMQENIGNVNMRALEIYDAVEKEYNSLIEKKNTLSTEKESVLLLMQEIEGKKKELFMRSFDGVNNKFKEIFGNLTSKGEASLELDNMESPFEDGMSIKVRLTGNKFMDIRSLSGGEKTMTALAFIFAVQEHEPASFYILDEVDAALDKKNSERLARLIRKYCDNAQYIVISHNDGVISEGDILYGVSMNEAGISNVVSLKL